MNNKKGTKIIALKVQSVWEDLSLSVFLFEWSFRVVVWVKFHNVSVLLASLPKPYAVQDCHLFQHKLYSVSGIAGSLLWRHDTSFIFTTAYPEQTASAPEVTSVLYWTVDWLQSVFCSRTDTAVQSSRRCLQMWLFSHQIILIKAEIYELYCAHGCSLYT